MQETLKSNDLEKIKKAKEEVLNASHKLAEEIYKEANKKKTENAGGQEPPADASQSADASASQSAPKEEPKKRDDVIDADYKEENK